MNKNETEEYANSTAVKELFCLRFDLSKTSNDGTICVLRPGLKKSQRGRILEAWPENGRRKWHYLVWNRVRIWRTGQHMLSQPRWFTGVFPPRYRSWCRGLITCWNPVLYRSRPHLFVWNFDLYQSWSRPGPFLSGRFLDPPLNAAKTGKTCRLNPCEHFLNLIFLFPFSFPLNVFNAFILALF